MAGASRDRRWNGVIALGALALLAFGAPACGDGEKKDVTREAAAVDPVIDAELRAAATAIMRGLAARDVDALLPYTSAEGLEQAEAGAPLALKAKYRDAFQPGHPAWERLFGDASWRYAVAKGWDGEIRAVRTEGSDNGWVWVGSHADEKVVVALGCETVEDAQGNVACKMPRRWILRDLQTPTDKRWNDFGAKKGDG